MSDTGDMATNLRIADGGSSELTAVLVSLFLDLENVESLCRSGATPSTSSSILQAGS